MDPLGYRSHAMLFGSVLAVLWASVSEVCSRLTSGASCVKDEAAPAFGEHSQKVGITPYIHFRACLIVCLILSLSRKMWSSIRLIHVVFALETMCCIGQHNRTNILARLIVHAPFINLLSLHQSRCNLNCSFIVGNSFIYLTLHLI